ncbi:unnamed protein product [Phytophthora fragariaefolia]|uniref:Unnamed protein product n=1 Tax=Phytophthora fragariaefolia TaxID=1490495 RepID=A0A9W6XB13_9STRA|nr:unnamed protein product [Phytophthora fragariaefolia]
MELGCESGHNTAGYQAASLSIQDSDGGHYHPHQCGHFSRTAPISLSNYPIHLGFCHGDFLLRRGCETLPHRAHPSDGTWWGHTKTYSPNEHHITLLRQQLKRKPGSGRSGNGNGGSHSTPRILWMASVSYAYRTTHNAAEHHGLLIVLRYVARHRLLGLSVVKDSNLILTQLRSRKAPRATHLQGRYAQCRLLADQLQITTWTHHLREFNKSPDKLANIAMDTKKSVQGVEGGIPRLTPTWAPCSHSSNGMSDTG